MPAALFLLAALCLLSVTHAVLPTDRTDAWFASHIEPAPVRLFLEHGSQRVSRRLRPDDFFGLCPCSSTGKGHPPSTHPAVKRFTSLLTALGQQGGNEAAIKKLRSEIEDARSKIVKMFGEEGFVNLDAHLRTTGGPGYCVIDKKSKRSMYPYANKKARESGTIDLVSMKKCGASPEFRLRDPKKQAVGDKSKPGKKTPAPGGGVPKPVAVDDNTGRPADGSGSGKGAAGDGKGDGTSTDASSGRAPVSAADASTFDAELGASPEPSPDAASADAASPSPGVAGRNRNEGCVAVEHLGSFPTQHATPLLRPVLCGRRLCATPNHALVVRGVWTSMLKLCGSGTWKCTARMAYVNNMKIAAGTRLRFDEDVVITPYDDRFPVAGPWIVQMAEDVVALVVIALRSAAFVAFGVLAHAAWVAAGRWAATERSGAGATGTFRALGLFSTSFRVRFVSNT